MEAFDLDLNCAVVSSGVCDSQEESYASGRSCEVENGGGGFWKFPFSCESMTRSSETDVGDGNYATSDFSDGFVVENNINESSLNHIPHPNPSSCSNAASGAQSRLCARGHWRPAEDTKLRELVALYGPQNWNLIAEKLEGRSGNIQT